MPNKSICLSIDNNMTLGKCKKENKKEDAIDLNIWNKPKHIQVAWISTRFSCATATATTPAIAANLYVKKYTFLLSRKSFVNIDANG